MKVNISLFFISFMLFACSKEKKFNSKVEGEWAPVSLKIADFTGIGYYAETQGSISFKKESKKSAKGNYTIDLQYVLNGVSKTFFETGTYTIKADKVIRKSTSTIENESIIIYINKEDFAFEIPNLNNERYLFILKRKG